MPLPVAPLADSLLSYRREARRDLNTPAIISTPSPLPAGALASASWTSKNISAMSDAQLKHTHSSDWTHSTCHLPLLQRPTSVKRGEFRQILASFGRHSLAGQRRTAARAGCFVRARSTPSVSCGACCDFSAKCATAHTYTT